MSRAEMTRINIASRRSVNATCKRLFSFVRHIRAGQVSLPLATRPASAYPNRPAPFAKGLLMFVVFDIGNVLVRWNPRNLFRKTMKDEPRMERFLATALALDFVSFTGIAADFPKAVKERARAFPEFAHELHLFDERWVETIGGPIEENIALLRRLRAAGRPVYALSNFATVKFAIARSMFDFLGEFDHAVISGHVGVVKPDPRIFEILFERSGRRPEELLLVDDQLKNVEAARRWAWPRSISAPASISRASLRRTALSPEPAWPIAPLIFARGGCSIRRRRNLARRFTGSGCAVTIETRKLAAILAADVVGFSRLTGADEERTLARLRALRGDLIDPTVSVHNGRVVKRCILQGFATATKPDTVAPARACLEAAAKREPSNPNVWESLADVIGVQRVWGWGLPPTEASVDKLPPSR